MNILFVIGKLEYSGAENVLRAIAPELHKMGHEVTIALRFDCNHTCFEEIPLVYYGGTPVKRVMNLRKIVKERNCDVVVSFGFPYNLDCALLKLAARCKVILCERHDPSRIVRTKRQKQLKRLLYPLADGYIVQTNTTAEYYRQHVTAKAERVCVIPNPVRIVPEVRQKERIQRGLFVTVGRYDDAQKNHSLLINAFARFHQMHPECELRLYGEGEDRDAYEQLIAHHHAEGFIRLMGYSTNPIADMEKADVFCLTSNYEGMPNALIEAMSLGMPCISTRCGGGAAQELIEDGKNGLLTPCGDETALVNAMEKLYANTQFKDELAHQALGIIDQLSIGRIARMWEAFIAKINQA